MKCVHCGLLNPDGAVRCDCGYDFATQTLKDSYLPIADRKTHRRQLTREYAICCGIATLISVTLSAIPGGEAIINAGFFLAAKIVPGVGAHDQAFLLVWIVAFLINAAVYGFVVFGAWRGLKSVIR